MNEDYLELELYKKKRHLQWKDVARDIDMNYSNFMAQVWRLRRNESCYKLRKKIKTLTQGE